MRVCVYWKAGSEFPTTLVIASSFVGSAGTKTPPPPKEILDSIVS